VAITAMSTTRRTVLGGALTAPLLAHLTGTASGDTQDATYGHVSRGALEFYWSPQTQTHLGLLGATVTAVAPARFVTNKGRKGILFPIRSGTGDPALSNPPQARGSGEADGGLVARTSTGKFEFTRMQCTLEDELISGKCLVNGVESARQSLLRCDSSKGRLLAAPVPPGQPLTVRIEEVPVYPTTESLEAFTTAFGTSPFTPDTILGHATIEAEYIPPRP
jgi:hypothetical protein